MFQGNPFLRRMNGVSVLHLIFLKRLKILYIKWSGRLTKATVLPYFGFNLNVRSLLGVFSLITGVIHVGLVVRRTPWS